MTNDELLKSAMREHQAGQLKEAESNYRRVLVGEPARPDALEGLGVLALQLGRREEAMQLLRRAAAAAPLAPSVFLNLGAALDEIGNYDEAVAAYRRALSLRPDYARALSNLGNTLRKMGMIQESIAACRRSLVIKPDSAQTHNNLGAALLEFSPDEAIAHYQIALNLRPNFAEALDGMGSAMLRKGNVDEAVNFCRKAVQLKPGLHEAQVNLGSALAASAMWELAEGCFERAIELAPESAIAHWNMGLMHLLQGDFVNGWPEYEWRLRVRQFKSPFQSSRPRWDGSELNGRRIVLFAEQGLGDAIQFARFIPRVAQSGGKISVVCHRELQRVFKRIEQVELCAAFDEPVPEHDVQYPLLSLAGFFQRDLTNLPSQIPYLAADPALSSAWKARVPADGRKKIGLVWSGKMVPLDRSIPVKELAALARFDGFWFCSLQKWEAGQTPTMPALPMTEWTGELNDLADTAALIENLDAVITIDTSVAHLAGAMGKKTWVLLRKACDWRWLLDRADSPWYPNTRLCRQQQLGEWAGAVDQLLTELKSL